MSNSNKKHIKLLVKITPIYILVTLIAFIGMSLFLTNEADEFIDHEMNHLIGRMKWKVVHEMRKGNNPVRYKFLDSIEEIDSTTAKNFKPTLSDTTIYMEEKAELMPFLTKIDTVRDGGKIYKLKMLLFINDFQRFRDDIFESVFPAFIFVSVTFIAFSFFFSGYLFTPFNQILRKMATYKVGRKDEVVKVSTSTDEFFRMQELFHSMVMRIEEDFRLLKEYTENMAHEFQTPLTIIRNKTDRLLSDESVLDKHLNEIKTIYDETNYLSKLGSVLNLYTKIENNEFTNKETLVTESTIKNYIHNVLELAELKNISLTTELESSHTIQLDPVLFNIILKNLITNAINYTDKNGTIKIETTKDSLLIANSGVPLNFDESNLFKRFGKPKNSRYSIGLGLAIVYKICETNSLNLNYTYRNGFHNFSVTTKK